MAVYFKDNVYLNALLSFGMLNIILCSIPKRKGIQFMIDHPTQLLRLPLLYEWQNFTLTKKNMRVFVLYDWAKFSP